MTVRSSKSEMTVASSSIDADERMGSSMQRINATTTMHKQSNAKKLSKVEKRRMAAQIKWETRRKRMGRPAKRTKLASSDQQGTGASMQGARRRTRAVSKTDTETSTSSEYDNGGDEESEVEDTTKKPLSRSEAARLGWARRKKMLAVEQSNSDEEVEEDEEETAKKSLSRAEAARLGWQRRKQMLAEAKQEEERRRQAAKMGWEKRKKAQKQLAVTKAKGKRKPVRGKGYGAAARARAAKRGWERRKLVLAGADLDIKDEELQQKKNSTAKGQDRVSRGNKRNICAVINEPSTRGGSAEESKSSNKDLRRIPAWLKSKPREGAKRSRRLAEDSADSHEESVRKKNELVTFLKESRGWMEFHPSSRLGSGTATYGYIPSSIASFIRGGTVSKTVVLEQGKLGVDYALDYEGYGGLKEMIGRYGVDYSPYPTEEMLEVSRKVLGNRNAMQVSLWDLGGDLPWKEVEQAEEKKINEFQKMMELKKEKDETSDLLFVADILASFSHGPASDDRSRSLENDKLNHDIVSDSSFSDNQCSGRELVRIESSSSISNKSVTLEANAVSHKVVKDDIFSIQSQSDFRQWSFGIC